MKKTFLLLSLALIAFSSCQKEAKVGGTTLTATIEQQVETNQTKTYLEGGVVKWSAGDAVKVFYSDKGTYNGYQFNLTNGAGTTTANFKCNDDVSGTPQYAIYPYSAGTGISGSIITFTLPATQTYAANSFGNGANVAVAQVSGSGMDFKNVCGVLRISLTGYGVVDKLVLSGNNNEKLNGSFSVDASSSDPSATVTTTTEDDEKTITLDCSASKIYLNSTTPTKFNFVVPVGAFETTGFTVEAYGPNDNLLDVEITTDADQKIKRSIVKNMSEAKDVKGVILPAGCTKLEYIQSSGTQYINTNIAPKAEITSVDFAFDIQENNGDAQAIFGCRSIVTTDAGNLYNFFYCTSEEPNRIRNDFSIAASSYPYYDYHYIYSNPIELNNQLRICLNADSSSSINSDVFGISKVKKCGCPYAMFIGTVNTGGSAYTKKLRGRIYYCKIYENNVLVLHLVPANMDGYGVGMYDIVSGEAYTNEGTGTFTAGSPVTD